MYLYTKNVSLRFYLVVYFLGPWLNPLTLSSIRSNTSISLEKVNPTSIPEIRNMFSRVIEIKDPFSHFLSNIE